jgi:predicted Rossmann fold nucleotide-binding protein DprA/Smf involved in DNA uptake
MTYKRRITATAVKQDIAQINREIREKEREVKELEAEKKRLSLLLPEESREAATRTRPRKKYVSKPESVQREEILEELRKGSRSLEAIAGAVEVSGTTAIRRLNELIAAGKVERAARGIYRAVPVKNPVRSVRAGAAGVSVRTLREAL